MSDQPLPDIALPSGWAKNVKTAVLHVISLAHYAIVSARGWSLVQTARAFLVQRLKVLCPAPGKAKLAQVLARAGLHLGVTTIGRMLKAKNTKAPPSEPAAADATEDASPAERVVTAKRPNYVWHVDLTAVPLGSFSVPWLPFALPQRWPFCWWLAVAADHFSRRVMCVAVFRKQPDSGQVTAFLAKSIRDATTPKYIICDKGTQFWCKAFKRWCRRRKIRPRYGAVGQYGSIAVIEWFIRTLKDEGFRRILVPLRERSLRTQADQWVAWFNEHRPHTALDGKTPNEAYRRIAPANKRPRCEPRKRWPRDAGCAGPKARTRRDPGVHLKPVVGYLDGQKHLPEQPPDEGRWTYTPDGLSLWGLRHDLPLSWEEQRTAVGPMGDGQGTQRG